MEVTPTLGRDLHWNRPLPQKPRRGLNLGPHIANGNTTELSALDADRVVKRFKDGIDVEVAQREAENTRVASEAGLPVPRVYEITSVEGNSAIAYKRISGESMFERIGSRPWTLRWNARSLARLQAGIHEIPPSGLQTVRERLETNIREASDLEPRTRQTVLERLKSPPDGEAF